MEPIQTQRLPARSSGIYPIAGQMSWNPRIQQLRAIMVGLWRFCKPEITQKYV